MPITIPVKKKATSETEVATNPGTKAQTDTAKGRKKAALQPEHELLSLKQVAGHLQTCMKTARKLIKDKGVPVYYAGRQLRISRKHIPLLLETRW